MKKYLALGIILLAGQESLSAQSVYTSVAGYSDGAASRIITTATPSITTTWDQGGAAYLYDLRTVENGNALRYTQYPPTSGSYTITSAPLPEGGPYGAYTTAMARDYSGNNSSVYNLGVTFYVDLSPPTGQLSQSGATTTISANDVVGLSRAELFSDGGTTPYNSILIATLPGTSTFTQIISLPTAPGMHTIFAKIYDLAGRVTQTNTVTVTVVDNISRRLIGTYLDASGFVETRIWEAGAKGQINFASCSVDPDFVLIGGGAWADYGTGAGALLISSNPDAGLTGWIAESKDHDLVNVHMLHVYAIGLRLVGVTRSTLFNSMIVATASNAGGWVAHPDVSVSLPPGYQLVGGGAKVLWSGAGNLLTASYPSGTNMWSASSKDHVISSPGSLTAFAIGITTGQIPGFGSLKTQTLSSTIASPGYSVSTAFQSNTPGYNLACVGGRATYTGPGRLLFKIAPNAAQNAYASSKDHEIADSGSTTVYSVIIQKQ